MHFDTYGGKTFALSCLVMLSVTEGVVKARPARSLGQTFSTSNAVTAYYG